MPQAVSLGQMGRSLLGRPVPVAGPDTRAPEAPNRPLGQDWIGDAIDVILGGIGINDPMDPSASSATGIGGMVGAALPLGMAGKLGRAASDLKAGFTLPRARVPLSETRMREFLAQHGGTAAPDVTQGIRVYPDETWALSGRKGGS